MNHTRSKGAALIVSLILLTAVTTIAIVSMEQSSTQIRIVNSNQQNENVFNTSMSELEAMIDLALIDTMPLAQARYTSSDQDGDGITDVDPDTQNLIYAPFAVAPSQNYDTLNVSVTTTYAGKTPLNNGTTISQGNSMGIQEIPFILTAITETGRQLANGRRAFSSQQSLRFTYKSAASNM